MECALAKPQSEQKPAGGSSLQRTGLLPGYPHGAGYGMMGSAYGALGAGYVAAGFTQVRRYNCVSLCYCTLCNLILNYLVWMVIIIVYLLINHFGFSFNVQGDCLIASLVILSCGCGFMIYTHEDLTDLFSLFLCSCYDLKEL